MGSVADRRHRSISGLPNVILTLLVSPCTCLLPRMSVTGTSSLTDPLRIGPGLTGTTGASPECKIIRNSDSSSEASTPAGNSAKDLAEDRLKSPPAVILMLMPGCQYDSHLEASVYSPGVDLCNQYSPGSPQTPDGKDPALLGCRSFSVASASLVPKSRPLED